jgi:hypothetical protein
MNSTHLLNVINSPKDALYNFMLGQEYEKNGQNASAVSFYLRAAEFSTDDLLSYEALIRLSFCLERTGNRQHTVKGILLRAVALLPRRPEAYFLLSRTYERNKEWHECYSWASIGESKFYMQLQALITDVEYPGKYVFTFEKAVASWWIGLWSESLYLFRELRKRKDLSYEHKISIENNYNSIKNQFKKPINYDSSMYPDLKVKFVGADKIERNYSQAYQDMFILTMLNGKRNGTFVEIGCYDAFYNSNTVLLETKFGWSGHSIDINPEITKAFATKRNSNVITGDATKLDYGLFLDKEEYDYLQVDCEPAGNSFQALQKVGLEKHKFAVITFEHDKYCDDDTTIQEKSKQYLESFGYIQVVNNISEDLYSPFEDWWVHPDLVSKDIVTLMTSVSDKTKKADLYMLNKL